MRCSQTAAKQLHRLRIPCMACSTAAEVAEISYCRGARPIFDCSESQLLSPFCQTGSPPVSKLSLMLALMTVV